MPEVERCTEAGQRQTTSALWKSCNQGIGEQKGIGELNLSSVSSSYLNVVQISLSLCSFYPISYTVAYALWQSYKNMFTLVCSIFTSENPETLFETQFMLSRE